ncbi:hypothetical protein L596_025404 [Steinernema carpocapsae]|uniref:Uncharacterized protein n=1 Tax=Steinernema carpocapsae TaxID=34508 RepID=A0A4U5M7R3_STECR|nr:hypothetical protein L596_025404 [Steinernema carpocapsae]
MCNRGHPLDTTRSLYISAKTKAIMEKNAAARIHSRMKKFFEEKGYKPFEYFKKSDKTFIKKALDISDTMVSNSATVAVAYGQLAAVEKAEMKTAATENIKQVKKQINRTQQRLLPREEEYRKGTSSEKLAQMPSDLSTELSQKCVTSVTLGLKVNCI